MSAGAREHSGGTAGTLAGTIVLAAWLGAALYFSVVVAQAAFRVLPSRALAGALVGQTLPALFITGFAAGVAAALLAAREPRAAWARMGRLLGSAGAALACGIGQFVIGPRIDRLRLAIGDRLESLPASDPLRAAFGRLHGLSVLALGAAIILALTVVVLGGRRIALSAGTRD